MGWLRGYPLLLLASLSITAALRAEDLYSSDGSYHSHAWLEYDSDVKSMPQCNPKGSMVKLSSSLLDSVIKDKLLTIEIRDSSKSMTGVLFYDAAASGFLGKIFNVNGEVFLVEPILKQEMAEAKCSPLKYKKQMNLFHKLTPAGKLVGNMPELLFNPLSSMGTLETFCNGLFCYATDSFKTSALKKNIFVPREIIPKQGAEDGCVFTLKYTQPSECRGALCDIYYYENKNGELLEITPNGQEVLVHLYAQNGNDLALKRCKGNNFVWTEAERMMADQNNNNGRVAPGPGCWFTEQYCNPFKSEQITFTYIESEGKTMEDIALQCYQMQQDYVEAFYFTLIKTRLAYTCYILKDCSVDQYATCIERGTCISGPDNCEPEKPNQDCQPPPDLGPDYMKWQCIDKRTNRLGPVDPTIPITSGVICLLSCESWLTTETNYHSLVTRGYLKSVCRRDGTWSDVKAIDGSESLIYPLAPYPRPDATLNSVPAPLQCTCNDLTLNMMGTNYNPNDEEGADFKCTTPIGNSLPLVIEPKNECFLFCDGILALEFTCSQNGWTGEPNRGIWCFKPNPINGNWGAWSAYGAVNPWTGLARRTRLCNNPRPQHGGNACEGPDFEDSPFPVNGAYGEWTDWSSPDPVSGVSSRSRACDNPPPLNGGAGCSDPDVETRVIPVNGNWGEWSEWNIDPEDPGRQVRRRLCNNPAPNEQGESCDGPAEEYRPIRDDPQIVGDLEARLSSLHGNFPAENCIDGNFDNFCHSENKGPHFPWLAIKLPGVFKITQVRITSRKNCCGQGRTKNIRVSSINSWPSAGSDEAFITSGEAFASWDGPAQDGELITLYGSSTGSYVLIQMETFVLQFAEVQVFGTQDCSERGIDYHGYDLPDMPTNAVSAEECQMLCQETPNCGYYAYSTTGSNQCWLKTSDANRGVHSGRISGPKFCNGVDGNWGEWSQWAEDPSEPGREKRTRLCNNPTPNDLGEPCPGPAEEFRWTEVHRDCRSDKYQWLTDESRSSSLNRGGNLFCDKAGRDNVNDFQGPGWYRFTNNGRLPTSAPAKNMCGTHAPGWLRGNHPTVAEEEVSGEVCFHWNNGHCHWNANIKIRNCGAYFIYHFPNTPVCHLRYCASYP